ncbi:MAG: GNAT family N-acetyltransferase [Dehalococcoidia bacterium]|nr:GNAT family N-acetyltransferase [Dehalococcoidia bacterium]
MRNRPEITASKGSDQEACPRLEVWDGSFSARLLDPRFPDDVERARAFRHEVFLEELGWSLPDGPQQEVDEYDQHSVHFGAFAESPQMAGYCRLILPVGNFMIEKDFSDLVAPDYSIRKQSDTVEISRFAIHRRLRGKQEGFRLIAVLLRCVYSWAKANQVRYIYGVCASDHLSFVQGAFSCCDSIGPAYQYQPGIFSSALRVDLGKLDVEKVKDFWSQVVGKPR